MTLTVNGGGGWLPGATFESGGSLSSEVDVTVITMVQVVTFPFTSVALQVTVVAPIFNFTLLSDLLPLSKATIVAPLRL